MKLIALRDFAKVGDLEAVEIDGLTHPRHIHKGAVFEIGNAKNLLEMNKTEKANAALVAQLFVSRCIGDATDEKVVKAVKEEIELDKKREANAAKLNEAAQTSHLGEALLTMLKQGKVVPAK